MGALVCVCVCVSQRTRDRPMFRDETSVTERTAANGLGDTECWRWSRFYLVFVCWIRALRSNWEWRREMGGRATQNENHLVIVMLCVLMKNRRRKRGWIRSAHQPNENSSGMFFFFLLPLSRPFSLPISLGRLLSCCIVSLKNWSC